MGIHRKTPPLKMPSGRQTVNELPVEVIDMLPIAVIVLENLDERYQIVYAAGGHCQYKASSTQKHRFLDEITDDPLLAFIHIEMKSQYANQNHVNYFALPDSFLRLAFWVDTGVGSTSYIFIWGVDIKHFSIYADTQHSLPWLFYQSLFVHCPDAVVLTDAKKRITDFNVPAGNLLRCGKEIIGQPIPLTSPSSLISDDLSSYLEFWRKTGVATQQKFELKRNDGTVISSDGFMWPVFNQNQDHMGFGFWFRGSPSRNSKITKDSCSESIVSSSGLMLAQISEKGTILFTNSGFQQFFNLSSGQTYDVQDLFDKESLRVIQEEVGSLCASRNQSYFEILIKHPDGSVRLLWALAVALFNPKEELTEWHLSCYDITNDYQKKKFPKGKQNEQIRVHQAIITAIEDERTRISNELHDNISNLITIIRMKVELCLLEETPSPDSLKKILALLNTTAEEARKISHNLSPGARLSSGLRLALNSLFSETILIGGEHPEIHFNVDFQAKIKDDVEFTIFRIIQEALTNAVKHSSASHFEVFIHQLQSFLLVQISDNGLGFKTDIEKRGHGIDNMKHRAHLLGSNLYISSSHAGTRISLAIPAQTAY